MDKPKNNRFIWIMVALVIIVLLAVASVSYVMNGAATVQATVQAAKLGTGVP